MKSVLTNIFLFSGSSTTSEQIIKMNGAKYRKPWNSGGFLKK